MLKIITLMDAVIGITGFVIGFILMEVTGVTKFTSSSSVEFEETESGIDMKSINSEIDKAITPDVERFINLREKVGELSQGERISSLHLEDAEVIEEEEEMSFDKFIDHLTRKYMLVDATISTTEGLLVASNSKTPEDDAAMATEMMDKVKNIYGGVKEVILSTEGERRYIFRITGEEELIAHLRSKRELTNPEIRGFRKDITQYMEGYT